MIYQYELSFTISYSDKTTDLQTVIVAASSLEESIQKLYSESVRRFGKCTLKLYNTSLYTFNNDRYTMS